VILSGPGRSGGDEPGVEAIGDCVHKRRALNTWLSSGTSTGTFAVSAGPYRNYQTEAGTKNEPDTFFVPVQKQCWKIDPHVSNLRFREFLFRGVQVHLKRLPLKELYTVPDWNLLPKQITSKTGSPQDFLFYDEFMYDNICFIHWAHKCNV